MVQKELVRAILKNAAAYSWSLQGFGMLRLYLSDEVRLHVWSNKYAEPNVSLIHTHPWNFTSNIIAGEMINYRFKKVDNETESNSGLSRWYQKNAIHCGENGGLVGKPKRILMRQETVEYYREGDSYYQKHDEIHASLPANGSVTIIQRSVIDNPDRADVYWLDGESFVSAKPRKATEQEVDDITSYSLKRWFK